MNAKSYSTIPLSLAGLLLSAMGLYFIFLRPPLLSEDLLYMGLTLQTVKDNMPNLLIWLQKVFWVMGGYIFTTGLFTVFISLTSFRSHLPWAFITVTLAGLSSIGLMTLVNFMINSNFRWVLLAFTLLWVTALVLYKFDKRMN